MLLYTSFLGKGGTFDFDDPYYPEVLLLVSGNGVNGGTVFTDESIYNRTVTANGNAQTVTAQSRFGGSSVYFDGTGDYLSCPDSDDWNFAAEPFTIEGFVKWETDPSGFQQLFGHQRGSDNQRSFALSYDGPNNELELLISNNGSGATIVDDTYVPGTSSFHHIASDFDGETYRNYADGVLIGSGSTQTIMFDSSAPFTIGGQTDNFYFQGWMNEVRITRGVARYKGAFTPPTQPFPRSGSRPAAPNPSFSNVKMLANWNNGVDEQTSYTDQSSVGATATFNGNAKLDTAIADPFGNSTPCLRLDGNNDFVTFPDNAAYTLGSSPFCVEGWMYLLAYNTGERGNCLMSHYINTGNQRSWAAFYDTNASPFGLSFISDSNGSGTGTTIKQGCVPQLNRWHHWAWSRIGDDLYTWFNGILIDISSLGAAFSYHNSTTTLVLGALQSTSGFRRWHNGLIGPCRFTVGESVYTTEFTRPATYFPTS